MEVLELPVTNAWRIEWSITWIAMGVQPVDMSEDEMKAGIAAQNKTEDENGF